MQFVTIREIKIPSDSYTLNIYVCINISMVVTNAAMIRIYAGILTSGIIRCRHAEITMLLIISTTVVAKAKPNALTVVDVTANVGHKPKICTRMVLFFQTSSLNNSIIFFHIFYPYLSVLHGFDVSTTDPLDNFLSNFFSAFTIALGVTVAPVV